MNAPASSSNSLLVQGAPGTHWLLVLVMNLRSGQSHQSVFGPFTSKELADHEGRIFTESISGSAAAHDFRFVARVISIT